jgi:hypothetical protein
LATPTSLAVAPSRPDGNARPYTTVWVVRVGGDLYVRSYRGRAGAWYKAAQRSKEGRIRAGGVERDVSFEPPATDVDQSVDDAYRAKYGRSAHVDAMLLPDARPTTLRLAPH